MCGVFAAPAVVGAPEGRGSWGRAGMAGVPTGRGGRAPAQEAAHAEGGTESCVPEVVIKELNDFGHESPQTTQWCLEAVRSPNMFVSPFCCS